ncbi:MAG: sensor domain-containing diguanylate cyclase [Thiolinea sp.]
MNLPTASVSAIDIVNAIRNILNIDQRLSGLAYLRVLLKNISSELGFRYVFVGHASGSESNLIYTDVAYMAGELQPNFEYKLEDTPCKIVMGGDRVCMHPDKVHQKFPKDILLQTMGIVSYAGSPTISPRGDLLGLLVLADDKPMSNTEQIGPLVEFLAQRITAEYERHNIQEELHKIIKQRTKALETSNANLKKTVDELELIKRELELKNQTDALTNVHRREWFTELAQAELQIARRNCYPLSLLFIDLDSFKEVNDSYGHSTGDAVLKEVAGRIKSSVSETDIVGRFGGEEFVLLSPFANTKEAIQLAEHIRNEISGLPIHTPGSDIFITASIGITSSNISDYELNNLVEHADNALYQAKAAGRNNCVLYEKDA